VQPGPRVVRHPVGRPLQRGGQQCLLDGVLAGVELAVPAHQRAEDLRRQLAQQVLGRLVGAHISGGASATWRSSTLRAYFTIRPQISTARASLSTSSTQ
jgi:hypothetical protein